MKNVLSSNFALQVLIVLGTLFSLSTDFISQSWSLLVGLIGFMGVARLELKKFEFPDKERLKEINYVPYLIAIIASLVEFFPLIAGDVEKLKESAATGNWFAVASAMFSIITIIVKSRKSE